MAKRFYTFIVVPNASSRLHKVRVPEQAMYVLAAIGFISFFVAVGMSFSYMRMAFKVSDYNTLQTENTELKVQTKNLEVSTKKLSTKLTNLETLSAKLSTLIENDSFMKRFGKNGVGGSKTDYPTSAILKNASSAPSSSDDIESLKGRASELESHMTLLQQVAEKRAKVKRFTPTIWPLKGEIRSKFGGRSDPFTGGGENHLGLDISGMYGAPVRAVADGLVIFAGRQSDYGNLIIIDHGNGITTRLGHLSRFQTHGDQRRNRGERRNDGPHDRSPPPL
jgi:murein DD-endopeptidase MepM/ murein hydrolase activator NlpD